MTNLYDNGYKIIGKVSDFKTYIRKNCEDMDLLVEIYSDIKHLNDNDIIYFDYERAMGYDFDVFHENDKMEV